MLEKKKGLAEWALYALLLMLPAATLYWLVPFASDLTIGNDYGLYSIHHQLELAYSREHGSFPLYAPGFLGGHSTAALTLGQLYHPISYIASATPGYWHGHALTINTLYRLLSLGICQLVIFVVLRRIGLRYVPAFIVSFITVYNLRMLDNFRYGANLENYTGYLLLSAALTYEFIRPTRILGRVAITLSTYLLVVGGHPQAMYLGLLGAILVVMLAPFVVPAINPEFRRTLRNVIKYWGLSLGFVTAGLLLAAPYICSFYFEFVLGNAARVGRDYRWSLSWCDTWGGGLRSLFAPLGADVHGAFGSSSLLLLPLFAPVLLVFRQRVPAAILVALGVISAVFLVTLGEATILHFWFWKYVPLAANFRVPGRVGILLPFLFLFVLAWVFRQVDTTCSVHGRTLPFAPLFPLAFLAAVALIMFNEVGVTLVPEPSHFVPSRVNGYEAWVEPSVYGAGLATLVFAALYSIHVKWKPTLWRIATGLLLCLSLVFQVTAVLRFGTWVTNRVATKTLAQMDIEKQQALKYYGSTGDGLETAAVTEQITRSIVESRMARFYRTAIAVPTEGRLWEVLSSQRNAHNAVLLAAEALSLTPRENQTVQPDTVTLTRATFNMVCFDVNAGERGVLATNYPYDKRWRATINGKPVSALRANGNETAIIVPQGNHQIVFRYESWASTAGAIVASVTFALLGIGFAFLTLRGAKRWIAASVALAIPGLLFSVWYSSLEASDDLGTRYKWDTSQLPPKDNLAYAKQASMSSFQRIFDPYACYAGLGVDGSDRGFATRKKQRLPWWQVDLGRVYSVGDIVIYDRGSGRRHLPLDIYISQDRKTLHHVKRLHERPDEVVWRIPLNGVETRFIRLQSGSSKPRTMSFDEVEVYPQKN